MDKRDPRKNWFGPGAVAAGLGISIKALRVYERAGLVKPDRRESGWRSYGPAHIARLHTILALKAMGLPLKDIGASLASAPIDIARVLEAQAAHLDVQVDHLTEQRRRILKVRQHLATGEIPSIDQLFSLVRSTPDHHAQDDMMLPATGPMKRRRLFLTANDSAGGHLKARFRTFGQQDRWVVNSFTGLMRDPMPFTDDIAEFVARRAALQAADPAQCGTWLEPWRDAVKADDFVAIERSWPDLDRVEYWADPDPDGQLSLLHVLDWIDRRKLDTAKLHIVQGDVGWGECDPDDWAPPPTGAAVTADQMRLARAAWEAFCAPTPERWAKLLERDLATLPYLRATVVAMLEELPDDRTALGASERSVLSIIANGDATPVTILQERMPTLRYWQTGKLLDLFAEAPHPAILGLDGGPVDMTGVDADSRHNRYLASRLSLSEVGHLLHAGRTDFTRYGRINRWWGGTHLTNATCWRWDAERQIVIPPG